MATTSLLKTIVKPAVSLQRLSLRSASHFTYKPDEKCHVEGEKVKMNMFTAINNAMDMALAADDSTLLFGEDVAFGGVFRCSLNLKNKYGGDRVFNSKMIRNFHVMTMIRKFSTSSAALRTRNRWVCHRSCCHGR